MKTKNLFFRLFFVILLGIIKINGQTNVFSVAGQNFNNGQESVIFGLGAGQSAIPFYSVYIGFNSGKNTQGSSTLGNPNTFLGYESGSGNTTGFNNTFVGYNSGKFNTTANWNTFIGIGAGSVGPVTGSLNTYVGGRTGENTTTGNNNAYYGYQTGLFNSIGTNNSFFGRSAGANNTTGSSNTFIGCASGLGLSLANGGSQGNNNTFVGYESGKFSTGSNSVVLGYQSGMNSGASSNSVFIGYQSGQNEVNNNRLYVHNSNTSLPLIYGEFDNRNLNFNVSQNVSSRAIITSGVPYVINTIGTSGLKFANLRNTNLVNSATSNNKVLSVDGTGDVILVNDATGITQNCSTANFVPVNSFTAGQLNCSQIFDNAISVGIGTTGPFNYTYNTGDFLALAPTSSTAKFKVNGVAWTTGYYASSDGRFKKDIEPIQNALSTISKIDGKTYSWNKEAIKEMNFDDGGHSGFIAQDLEKVLPHLVATDEKGNKAVNYMELIPYLVEAIKEQQTQINELKSQLTDSFKKGNQDLIALTNTKIISVSPNPSNDMMTVSFNIEKSVQSASLQVHDLNGNVMSSLKINDRDNNISRTLQKDNFGKGIFIVSLIINGKSFDTKKIIFN